MPKSRYRIMILSEKDGAFHEVKVPKVTRVILLILSAGLAASISIPLFLFGAYMNTHYASIQASKHIAALKARLASDERLTTQYHHNQKLMAGLSRDVAALASAAAAAEKDVGIIDTYTPHSTQTFSQLSQVIGYVSSILPTTTAHAVQQATYLAHSPAPFPFIWPVRGRVTSPFGMRVDPVVHIYQLHAGIDIGGRIGVPIYAAASGVVTVARSELGYGEVIFVRDSDGIFTVYAHESRMLVHPGAWVTQGQLIGLMGNTGWSTGPHLLFEILHNGRPVNPIPYLPPEWSPIDTITVVTHPTRQVRATSAPFKQETSKALPLRRSAQTPLP